jgi:KDO2-lipid IV(A) lauroyltransferase
MIEIEGWEHVETAARRGQGVIVFSAHFGNWEWGAVLLAARGLCVRVVALDHGSARVTRLFAEHRASHAVGTLPVRGSSFAIMKALHRGEVVCLASDREVTGQGVVARFFDQPTRVPRAAASLAIRTGASLIPAFMLRTGPSEFRAIFQPPIAHEDLSEEERTERLVDRYLRVIERQVRSHPEQWCVFEPIWDAPEPSS